MKLNWKKIFSSLLVVASIVVVIWIAFSNSDLDNAWDALANLDPIWLAALFGCWFAYVFFDSISYWFYFRGEGFRISILQTFSASLTGLYYSNITPSSAGGQPMQVNALRKAGIPVGYGTMAATIRFICNQFAFSFLSMAFWLSNREFVQRQLGDVVWLARLGWAINFAGVPLVILAAFQRDLIQRVANGLIGWLSRIHLIKNPEAALATTTNVLNTYHSALRELLHKPGQILLQVFNSFLSAMGLIGTTWFVYKAFHLSGTPWYQIITVGFLLYVSACYTPLPGASGAQEGGFLVFFRGIFPPDLIGLALLVWRFFTYYLFLIAGMINLIVVKIVNAIRRRREQGEQNAGAQTMKEASADQRPPDQAVEGPDGRRPQEGAKSEPGAVNRKM